MGSLPASAHSKTEGEADICVNGIAGTVSFVGPISGIVYLILSDKLASRMTSAMLGSDEVGPNEVKDVVGELTNMVTGGLKNSLSQAGFETTLTIPTIMRSVESRIVMKNPVISTTNAFTVPGETDPVTVRVLARKVDA